MFFNGLNAIFRTCWIKSTCFRQKWRNPFFIHSQSSDAESSQPFFKEVDHSINRSKSASNSWKGARSSPRFGMITILNRPTPCCFFLKTSRIRRFARIRKTAFPNRLETTNPTVLRLDSKKRHFIYLPLQTLPFLKTSLKSDFFRRITFFGSF